MSYGPFARALNHFSSTAPGLLDLLTGVDVEPTTGRNGKLWKTWNGRRNGAVDFILTRLDDSVLGHANEYQEDPAGLWRHLHAVFGDSGVGGGVRAWRRFAAVRFTGWDFQMSTVTGKIRGIADELERIIATMLSACAAFSEFRPIIASLESSKESLKVDDVELQLIRAAKDFTEERGQLNGGAIIPGDQTQALATTMGARPICTNPKCGQVGHTIENCFHEGGGKEGQFPDWYFKNCRKEETGPAVNNAMATFALHLLPGLVVLNTTKAHEISDTTLGKDISDGFTVASIALSLASLAKKVVASIKVDMSSSSDSLEGVALLICSLQLATSKSRHSKGHQAWTWEDHYHLLNQSVCVRETSYDWKYFVDPCEVALGLSTDGFAPFKKWSKTAWPILLVNYNLPPDVHCHLKHILSLGVIPGPTKPHDWDLFLWPLMASD
ncbi:hypothetical protein D9758_018380 [Tetrapyrgos nigripes]|uniref:Uncharacterized protein n=1 Tax=Tetrapyrgos nigripes TaxID=182062 RepID=A0A8H5BDU7_9AGAR|nr:hypothetical protein D9758_018380 [Tetrapyrgos nigripes]